MLSKRFQTTLHRKSPAHCLLLFINDFYFGLVNFLEDNQLLQMLHQYRTQILGQH